MQINFLLHDTCYDYYIMCSVKIYDFSKSKPNLKTSIEPGASKQVSSQEAEVMFFYANWCPHLQGLSHWNKLKMNIMEKLSTDIH